MDIIVRSALLFFFCGFATSFPDHYAAYRRPTFYYQSLSSPQRLMYMQYVQQPTVSQSRQKLSNAAAAFVAGDTAATGTYLKDEGEQIAEQSVLQTTKANSAHSIAEAYPSGYTPDKLRRDELISDIAKQEISEITKHETSEFSEIPEISELPELADLPEIPKIPELSDTPDVTLKETEIADEDDISETSDVQLPETRENDDDDADTNDDEYENVPDGSRKQYTPRAPSTPLANGAYFPIDLGDSSDGSFAIANSLSIGLKGSAKSQAIAYGTSDNQKLRENEVRRH